MKPPALRDRPMTLNEIYATYTIGSEGLVRAGEDNCGFEISREEIERIASISPTAEDFQRNWEG